MVATELYTILLVSLSEIFVQRLLPIMSSKNIVGRIGEYEADLFIKLHVTFHQPVLELSKW